MEVGITTAGRQKKMVYSMEIVKYLDLETCNARDFVVEQTRPPDMLWPKSLTLLTRPKEFDSLFRGNWDSVVAIIPIELRGMVKDCKQLFIFSPNPRLSFIKACNQFFPVPKPDSIGENAVIGDDVDIGYGTIIMPNVVITGRVHIGTNCLIKSGTVIGQKGFNFAYDEKGTPLPFLHYGGVVIGNNVEIGAFNTVCQGTLADTIIEDYVKTDDHIHIAHNVRIGYGSLIVCGSIICGSVDIGKRVWVGANCTIRDRINIGDDAFIGMGACVVKSVERGVTVMGNPARPKT